MTTIQMIFKIFKDLKGDCTFLVLIKNISHAFGVTQIF